MSAIGADATPLRELIRTFSSALLGYSGGVDSSVLAVVLRQELGRDRMLAAIGRSASYPAAQWAAALAIARRFDVPVVEIDTHELDDPRYLANPTNRCFFCKTELWSRLVPLARARGLRAACACAITVTGRASRSRRTGSRGWSSAATPSPRASRASGSPRSRSIRGATGGGV